MERVVLYADPGMVYTNGRDFGVEIWLADGADSAAYTQVPAEDPELADLDDYKAALEKLGVK